MNKLGMGGAPLGNLFDHINETVAAATVSAAWDSGVRHFDTAPHYGAGLSEHRIGAVLRLHPRDAYTLSTKVGRVLEPAPDLPERAEGFVGGLPFRRRFDYSAEGALRSLEDSMQRLGLSRVDTVYIHDLSEDWHGSAWPERFREAMTGAARVLTDLRRRGVIRAWGLGLNLVEPALATLEQTSPDIFLVAGRYTLLDHTALDRLFPACAARGVKVGTGWTVQFRAAGRRLYLQLRGSASRGRRPCARHSCRLCLLRRQPESCGAAVLRRASGR